MSVIDLFTTSLRTQRPGVVQTEISISSAISRRWSISTFVLARLNFRLIETGGFWAIWKVQ